MTEYVIDLDEDDWIGVPPGFPYVQWESAADWAADLAAHAVPDDAAERAVFEAMAISIASERPPQVDHTLWFTPLDGRAMGVAYLTVFRQENPGMSLDDLAVFGIESATPVQIGHFASEPFGEVAQSAATLWLSDVGGDSDDGVAGSIRTVGIADDMIFMLNAVDENLDVLAHMQQPMLALMESIRLLRTDAEMDQAAARFFGSAPGGAGR